MSEKPLWDGKDGFHFNIKHRAVLFMINHIQWHFLFMFVWIKPIQSVRSQFNLLKFHLSCGWGNCWHWNARSFTSIWFWNIWMYNIMHVKMHICIMNHRVWMKGVFVFLDWNKYIPYFKKNCGWCFFFIHSRMQLLLSSILLCTTMLSRSYKKHWW